MIPNVAPTPPSNRADAARKYLASRARYVFTAREVLAAIDPAGSVDVMSATLSNLARRGEITRHREGTGITTYSALPRDQALARLQRIEASRKASSATVLRHRRPPPKPTHAPPAAKAATRTAAPPPGPTSTHRPWQPANTRRANFNAPLATVDHSYDPKRALSNRLASDIAAFQQRGGQVERLGVTKLFRDLSSHDDQD